VKGERWRAIRASREAIPAERTAAPRERALLRADRFCILRFPPPPMSVDPVRSRAVNGSRTSPTRGCPSPPSSVARGVNYNRELTSRWLSENPQERARKRKREGGRVRRNLPPAVKIVDPRCPLLRPPSSPPPCSFLADARNSSRVLALEEIMICETEGSPGVKGLWGIFAGEQQCERLDGGPNSFGLKSGC